MGISLAEAVVASLALFVKRGDVWERGAGAKHDDPCEKSTGCSGLPTVSVGENTSVRIRGQQNFTVKELAAKYFTFGRLYGPC